MDKYCVQSKTLDKRSINTKLDMETAQLKHNSMSDIIQRAKINPKTLTQNDAMVLQKKIGNDGVSQLLKGEGKMQDVTVQENDEKLEGDGFLQIKKNNTIQKVEMPENKTGMPDPLKAGVENLSGLDMSDVRVNYNSDKPEKVGALAYTQGTDIHVAPGQEKHLAHEAWHVVQQKQGRVKATTVVNGMEVNDDSGLEKEADEIDKTYTNTNILNGDLIQRKFDIGKINKSLLNTNMVQRKVKFKSEIYSNESIEGLLNIWSMEKYKSRGGFSKEGIDMESILKEMNNESKEYDLDKNGDIWNSVINMITKGEWSANGENKSPVQKKLNTLGRSNKPFFNSNVMQRKVKYKGKSYLDKGIEELLSIKEIEEVKEGINIKSTLKDIGECATTYDLGSKPEEVSTEVVKLVRNGEFGLNGQTDPQNLMDLNKLALLSEYNKLIIGGEEFQTMKYKNEFIATGNVREFGSELRNPQTQDKKLDSGRRVPSTEINKKRTEGIAKNYAAVIKQGDVVSNIGETIIESNKECAHAEIILLSHIIKDVFCNGFPTERKVSLAGRRKPCIYCQQIINQFILANEGQFQLNYVKAQDTGLILAEGQATPTEYENALNVLTTQITTENITSKTERTAAEKKWLERMVSVINVKYEKSEEGKPLKPSVLPY